MQNMTAESLSPWEKEIEDMDLSGLDRDPDEDYPPLYSEEEIQQYRELARESTSGLVQLGPFLMEIRNEKTSTHRQEIDKTFRF